MYARIYCLFIFTRIHCFHLHVIDLPVTQEFTQVFTQEFILGPDLVLTHRAYTLHFTPNMTSLILLQRHKQSPQSGDSVNTITLEMSASLIFFSLSE